MTASTPATAWSAAAGSRRSARTHSASPFGGRWNHVARTVQSRFGPRRTTSRPRYPHPPVTSNRCIADGSLPSEGETLTRQTPPDTRTAPDTWPTPEDETVVSREDTLVGTPPPGAPPPVPPPEAGPPADRRIGAGMLLGLGALALVAAGLVIAWLLTHRDNTKQTTTVVVTTNGGKTALPPKVSVPRLVGLKEQQALVRVGQIGLRPKEVFR